MRILFYITLFLSLLACDSKEKKEEVTPLLFPDNTQMLFRINDKDNFLSAIANNTFWKTLNPHQLRPHEVKLLNSILTDDNLWVAFDTEGHFFAITPRISNDTISFWRNADTQIQKQAQFGKEWFYTIADNNLVIGDSETVSAYQQLKQETKTARQQSLEQLQKVGNTECVATLFFQKDEANAYFKSFFGTEILQNVKDWVSLDLFLEENNIRFSGMALIANANADIMAHTLPYQNNVLNVLPARLRSLVSYTFDDGDKLAQNDSTATNNPFKTSINGVAFAQTSEGQFAVASSFDVDETIKQLPVLSEDFQHNFSMYELNPDLPMDFFTAFVPQFVPKYVGVYEKFLVFTTTKDLLTSVINDMQRGNVLSANKSYDWLEQNSASNVSVTRLTNLYDNTAFSSKYPYIAENYRWAVFQQTPQNDYYVLNFISQKQTESTLSDEMKERFRLTLDDQMVIPPTILLNHRTKQLEIAVQDTNNDLYLIGNNGSLLWKKRLDGKIQSPIYQVDLFKNGFLQMAFTTEKSIWIIDRNGNVVEPFPLKYQNPITPLEVFDYDSNREYRFLFAENNILHLLDRKGQQVKGFLQRTNGKPLFTPKHYRFNGKDYLIYPSDNGIFNILHRNGENRITVKGNYRFSNNPPLVFNNLFMFTTQEGNLISIDEKGGMNRTNPSLVEPFYWEGNRYALTSLSGNILTIGGQRIELPEGKYARPKQFRIRGINYVSVNEQNTKKAYLYDEKGKLLKDFPVESVSPIAIDVDLDKSIWIVTEKSPTELVLYTMRQLAN